MQVYWRDRAYLTFQAKVRKKTPQMIFYYMELLYTENNHFSLNQAITSITSLLVVYVTQRSWQRVNKKLTKEGLIRRRDLIEEGLHFNYNKKLNNILISEKMSYSK